MYEETLSSHLAFNTRDYPHILYGVRGTEFIRNWASIHMTDHISLRPTHTDWEAMHRWCPRSLKFKFEWIWVWGDIVIAPCLQRKRQSTYIWCAGHWLYSKLGVITSRDHISLRPTQIGRQNTDGARGHWSSNCNLGMCRCDLSSNIYLQRTDIVSWLKGVEICIWVFGLLGDGSAFFLKTHILACEAIHRDKGVHAGSRNFKLEFGYRSWRGNSRTKT